MKNEEVLKQIWKVYKKERSTAIKFNIIIAVLQFIHCVKKNISIKNHKKKIIYF